MWEINVDQGTLARELRQLKVSVQNKAKKMHLSAALKPLSLNLIGG